jgi:hypothetical protein
MANQAPIKVSGETKERIRYLEGYSGGCVEVQGNHG